MAKDNSRDRTEEEPLASSNTLFYKIEALPEVLALNRRFPPARMEIKYGEIASVEHRRLVDYGQLTWVAVGVAIAYVFTSVNFVKDILAAFILEISLATGTTNSTTVDAAIRATADQVGMWLAAFSLVIAGYYLLRFASTLGHKLMIYRTGKNPVATPFPLTGESMELLAKLNEKIKEAGGISKKEAEELIGEQVRDLLDQRVKMQEKLMSDLKSQLKEAKTPAEKALVRLMLKEGMDKLHEQDQLIEHELKKTGLSRKQIFKKYRIKPPDKEFVDTIMKGGGLEALAKEGEKDSEEKS